MRDLGTSPSGIALERDGWILLFARFPQGASEWLREKREHLADPEFRRLTRVYDDPAAIAVLDSLLDSRATPALDRLHELVEERRT